MTREIVKTVNGYNIERTPGTQRFYYVYLTERKIVTFHSIKKAAEYIESLTK